MFCLPCAENSFDIVFTHHAMEPNGGKEKELLRELYRVTNKYLILLEPAYELVDFEAQKRMDDHGYIKNLYSSAKELGFEIVTWELYGKNHNDLNPTGLMIIKKNGKDCGSGDWGCPVTKSKLKEYPGVYYSAESLLAYPVIDGVPMLTRDNAVVATKFMNFRK